MERTADDLGHIIKARRSSLGRTQVGVAAKAKAAGYSVSEVTYRQIETGTYASEPTPRILSAISVGLDWPPGALVEIAGGADPAVQSIEVSSSTIDLDRLRDVDPEMFEQIRQMAALALERADKAR